MPSNSRCAAAGRRPPGWRSGRGRPWVLAALAEQGVGLVEEQDPAALLGAVEHAGEVLLGLADVLRDDEREVDAVDVAAGELAEQAALMVLPVPGGPWNRARWPGRRRAAMPHVAHQVVAVVDEQLDSWSWRRCSGGGRGRPRPWGLDALGRELGAEAGRAGAPVRRRRGARARSAAAAFAGRPGRSASPHDAAAHERCRPGSSRRQTSARAAREPPSRMKARVSPVGSNSSSPRRCRRTR
jgi:hypothetical protein